MRTDGAVQRVLAALDSLQRANALVGVTSPTQESGVVHLAAITATSPAACVGYFNLPASPAHATTEVLQIGASCGLLLHRLVILHKDDTALNGSVVGRTSPDPEACGVQVWASDLLCARGHLVRLVNSSNQGGGGSLTLIPPTRTEAEEGKESVGQEHHQLEHFVTDKLVIRGRFEHLTLCVYGWPLEIASDKRLTATKRFLSMNGVAHAIARLPVVESYPDVSPLDAAYFRTAQTTARSKASRPTGLETCSPTPPSRATSLPSPLILTDTWQSPVPSHQFKTFVKTLSSNAAVTLDDTVTQPSSLEAPSPGVDTAPQQQRSCLPLPSIAVLQQLACSLLPELQHTPQDVDTAFFLSDPTWRVIFSLLFSPLTPYRVYQTYIDQITAAADTSSSSSLTSLPVFEAGSATKDQKTLCLTLLAQAVKTSPAVLRLLISIEGLWAIAALANLELLPVVLQTEPPVDNAAPSPPVKNGSSSKGCEKTELLTTTPYKVQMAALYVLGTVSQHRLGVRALTKKVQAEEALQDRSEAHTTTHAANTSIYECLILTALKHRQYGRFQRRQLFAEICNNVRLEAVAAECVSAAQSCQQGGWQERSAVVGLAETLLCLMYMVQWDSARQQEVEEIGDSCCGSNLTSRITRLSQVGARRGERSDGLGPDCHPLSLRFTAEQAAKRFFHLTDGAPFLESVLRCRQRLVSLLETPEEDSSVVASTPRSKIEDHDDHPMAPHTRLVTPNAALCPVSRSILNDYRATGKNVTPPLHLLPFLTIVREACALLDGFVSWLLTTSVGASSFLASGYACFCPRCFNVDDVVSGHLKTSLVPCLPPALRRRLGRSASAYVLLYHLIKSRTPVADSILVCTEINRDTGAGCRKRGRSETEEHERDSYAEEQAMNETEQAVVSLSFSRLNALQAFVAEPENAEALLLICNDSCEVALYFADILMGLATLQLNDETKAFGLEGGGGTFAVSADHSVSEPLTHANVQQEAAVLAALCCVVEIVWVLVQKASVEFLSAFFSHWTPAMTKLSHLVLQSQPATTPMDNFKQRIQYLGESISATSWGRTDFSIDAYAGLDLHGDNRGGMLSSLVPSSLFTGLRQVSAKNVSFAHKVVDLAAAWNIVAQAGSEFLTTSKDGTVDHSRQENCLANAARLHSSNPTLFLAHDTSAASPCGASPLPSKTRLVKFLVSTLQSLSTLLNPSSLIPTSESVEIANSTQPTGGGASRMAPRLGGFSGVVGVPTLDVRWPEYRDAKEQGAATARTSSEHAITPPVLPSGWTSRTLVCLRLLLHTLGTSSRGYLGQFVVSSDDLAVALQATCLDDPVVALQTEHASVRACLTNLLVGASAALSPPLLQLFHHHAGRFEGTIATLWRSSVEKMLPVTQATLELTYYLLDAILPTAPYPVSPIFSSKTVAGRTLPSVSRFASTDGTNWVPGELTDSGLLNALVFLASRLTQSWVFLNHERVVDGQQRSVETIRLCLDLVCSLLRLWALRCPSSVPGIITTIVRHARLAPCHYVVALLLVSAIGGLGSALPANEAVVSLGDSQPALVAPELNGAEGRNLEAVIGRIKQMYIQRRQTDSIRTGIGAGMIPQPITTSVGSRLPASMTTLTLSSRVWLPTLMEESLFGVSVPHYLKFHIPLAPSPPPRSAAQATVSQQPQPPQQSQLAYSACGPGGYEWSHRRLGRLTMGHDGDILSLGIFRTDDQSDPAAHGGRGASPASVDMMSVVQDWSAWDRLRDLLFESLEEEAIEAAIESDRVPPFPLGLSPATVASITESRAQARHMTRLLMQETSMEAKKELVRLEKLSRTFKYLKVEDIAELMSLLMMSAFSSNMFLHATAAHTMATLTLTKGPPMLDVLLHVIQTTLRNLSSFLVKELASNRAAGIARLFVISKLFLFVDHAFSLFPAPMLETAIALVRLTAEGLRALQDVPVIDPACPTYPVLMGLFDCLLPAAVRLFRSGIHVFCNFVALLTQAPHEQACCGLQAPTATARDSWMQQTALSVKAASRFGNLLVSNQFNLTLKSAGSTAGGGLAQLQSLMALPMEALSEFVTSIRTTCLGLSAVLNQLPIAWDCDVRAMSGLNPLHSSDVNNNWTGLSVSTVESILATLELLETYLDAVQRAHLERHQSPATTDGPLQSLSVSGTANPVIKLDAFITTITDAAEAEVSDIGVFKASLETARHCSDPAKDPTHKRLRALCTITKRVLSVGMTLFTQCHLPSATLLLPFLTAEKISAQTFGIGPGRSKITALADEAVDLYGDLDNDMLMATKVTPNESAGGSTKKSFRDSCLEQLFDTFELLRHTFSGMPDEEGQRPFNATFSDVIVLTAQCCDRLAALRQIIREELTMDPPSLILRTRQLVDDFLLKNVPRPPVYSPTELPTPKSPNGLPLFVGNVFTGIASPLVLSSIEQLITSMNGDPLWKNCLMLDTTPVVPSCSDAFACLSEVLRANMIGETIPSTTSVQAHLAEMRQASQLETSSTVSVPAAPTPSSWRPPTPTSSINRHMGGGYPPPTATDPVTVDPFRARKSGPSSRAPSKHVDEFEAEQQAAAAAAKLEPKFDIPDASAQAPVEPSLDAIPQWTEFVASGVGQGIDVMEILKTPQLLQDPQIEAKFRCLMDLHPSIKTLFRMMELNI